MLSAWLLLLVGLAPMADLAIATPATDTAPSDIQCGSSRWAQLRAATNDYCRAHTGREDRDGCLAMRHVLGHCADAPSVAMEHGSVTVRVQDPRDGASYVWLGHFERRRGSFALLDIAYEYDDCDAMGVPSPPKGPIRFHPLDRRRHP